MSAFFNPHDPVRAPGSARSRGGHSRRAEYDSTDTLANADTGTFSDCVIESARRKH